MIPKEILKKIRQIELRTLRLVNESLAGQYHSVFKGQGMNFEEVREYQPGDEVRTIDWNVTARMSHPFVKKFVEERELTVMLIVDLSGSGLFGSGEQTKRELAEIASVLAFSAIRNNDKVGLILFTDEVEKYIPPKKGRRHVLRVIREILFYTPKRQATDLDAALQFLNRVAPHRAIAVVISDFLGQSQPTRANIAANLRRNMVLSQTLGQASTAALKQANRKHDVVAVQIVDKFEMELPALGYLVLKDAETGEVVEVNTGDARKRKAFAERQAKAQNELRKIFTGARIDAIQLKTGEPYAGGWGDFSKLGRSVYAMADTNAAIALPAPGTNSAELRGIKGPVHIPNSYAWVGWVLLVLAVAALAWFWWRRLRLKKPRGVSAIVIPPHRKAKDRLRNASELMSDPYAFCSLVSNVVRGYIEERFDLHAPERTTEEFLEELRTTTALHGEHKALLEEFLTHCDLVKFARHEPSHPELQGLLDAALRFIDETTVISTETPAPQTA